MDELFNVVVPDAALDAPAFELTPAGAYRTTLQPGTELVSNETGWKGVRLPFDVLRGVKDGHEYTRPSSAQFTVEHTNAEAVRIGLEGLVAAAAAFGLTESTQTATGTPGQRLTAGSLDELVTQFNAAAGTEVEVYVTVKKRKKGGRVVMKDDGSGPVMDNEIRRISALNGR